MAELDLPPYAPILIESMRSIGYSTESAVADLIDNSISAGAGHVQIQFRSYGNPYIAIIDDGHGMSESVLTEAMRHGTRNPQLKRSKNDLGRFGLGLKTASLSQCRKLTVASITKGVRSACCWDLDLVEKSEKWTLQVLDREAIEKLPHIRDLENQKKGTLVLWQDFDRLAAGESSLESALGSVMDRIRSHLALVFHRYISGEQGLKRLQVGINNNPVRSLDPYLLTHKATQRLPEETFDVDGEKIWVFPFILPHISKMTPADLEHAGGEEGLRRQQGFHVYRNKRLIIWGTWFRLARLEELSKLARVRVDIPNTLDHLWTLDIKKSTAYPPEAVRVNLKRIVDKIAESSKRTYTFRGRKTRQDGIVHTWERIQGREGIRYCINREHPVIKTLYSSIDEGQQRLVSDVIKMLESSFPSDALYSDMASDRRIQPVDSITDDLKEIVIRMLQVADNVDGGRQNLLKNLHLIEPFCSYPDVTVQIVTELTNAD